MSREKPLARLETEGLGLEEILSLVAEAERGEPGRRVVTWGISSNVTVDLLEPHLRRRALLDGSRAVVRTGSLGDTIGNLRRFRDEGVDAVLVLTFLDALVPALESCLADPGSDLLPSVEGALRDETRLALAEARGIGRVYVALLHRMGPGLPSGRCDRVDEAVARLNGALEEASAPFPNVRLVGTADVVMRVGSRRALSPRFYHRFRSPYTGAFFEELARRLSLADRAGGAYFYKALVLDADGTLWGGIAGEDRPEGLAIGPHDYPGNVFWRAQKEFLALRRQGVLLCLCSKNDPADVDAVFRERSEMVLSPADFAAMEVGWGDKADAISSLASRLGISPSAMVFLDDSAFECENVRTRLPGVRTFQVPRPSDYPDLVAEVRDLFVAGGISAESADKTEQYRIRAQAEAERERYATREEFLAALGLRVVLRRGEAAAAARIAELTQKSNQFNLTTRRYTEGEVAEMMGTPSVDVYSIRVADRFGDSGLVGVAILRRQGEEATVDSFLLSCRVLGRDVELAPWPSMIAAARSGGIRRIRAEYRPTGRNAQVAGFYDRLGFARLGEEGGATSYEAALESLHVPPVPHIEVRHDD